MAGPTRPASPSYRADIDGLRGVAVMAVIGFHAFPTRVRGGFVGVDVFFVISGFLISGILLGGLERGTFTFADFYTRRVRRIFPALATVLASCLLAGWLLLFAREYVALGKHTAGGAGFVANILLWRESGYFDAEAESKPLLHLWSLGIEEQFYLAWPLTLWLAAKSRVRPIFVVAILGAASFVMNVTSVRTDPVGAFYSPVTRLWELLAGAALACVPPARLPGSPRARDVASAIGLAGILSAVVFLDRTRRFPGAWALVPTGGAILILASGPYAWVNRVFLANRATVWIGLISYPLYLWHWPMLSFARAAYMETPPLLVRVAVVFGSIPVSWATARFVEGHLRFGPRPRAKVAGLSVAMAATLGAGLLVVRHEGFPTRLRNSTEKAHVLGRYATLHMTGLAEAYRSECDFFDWNAMRTRSSIDADCTYPGRRRTVFLWGDSYAQALSLGLRRAMKDDERLAQVATSSCRPAVGPIDEDVEGGRCGLANRYAVERITALRPDVVLLAQRDRHVDTDWIELAGRLHAAGARRVVLVGPAPRWAPSLPLVVVMHRWGKSWNRVGEGLVARSFEWDAALKARIGGSGEIEYVSMTDALCDATGCQATTPGTSPPELIAVDSGHLTPAGSIWVVDRVLRPRLSP